MYYIIFITSLREDCGIEIGRKKTTDLVGPTSVFFLREILSQHKSFALATVPVEYVNLTHMKHHRVTSLLNN